MATVVLAAAGASLGGAVGGSVLGLSSAVLGRAIGATIGRRIDEKLFGQGAEPVDIGRVDRFRVMGAQEGAALPKVQGRMRLGGHVIWATRFKERVSESGGGKNGGPVQRNYSYSISLAVALCEGQIGGVGRIWADGREISPQDLTMRVYLGDEAQEPDPLIEAVEGSGSVPAYRGVAYVVIEDMLLGAYGNRIPQLSFEVIRPLESDHPAAAYDIAQGVSGVALMPGTGEYALATTPVHFDDGYGGVKSANVNTPSGGTNFATSLDGLAAEMPGCKAAGLIVSWFGDDLRISECSLRPKVEHQDADGVGMPWSVSGLTRAASQVISKKDGLPIYGGTPCDASVVEAIRDMNARGLEVMFYPFILMEQGEGNGLPDPWSGAADQPVLPWRGRITSSVAAGQTGSPDGTAAAADEVAAFFGTVQAGDFTISDGQVVYSGPDEWSYRRFILHYAALCQAAGGVESFCIGSEMRGMTQIRADAHRFPAVEQLIALASDVRAILGEGVKIGYAADWSEYFGYHPQDGSGDVHFHLDPLWAHPDIDFIGMDNYMPLSDWREEEGHADAAWGSIYNPDYLQSNVEGGEGYDWFYHSDQARAAQVRTPIADGAFGEDWVWRYKDIRGWWSSEHYDRIDGIRQAVPSAWVPASKPLRFTEFGCAAIDKGTNQPNKFLDPKSSESGLPHYSNGQRDEVLQRQYFRAVLRHWKDPVNNPVSEVYGGSMIDMDHAYAWAWDARPYPAFPNNRALWSDAENYATGHWLNGRAAARSVADAMVEICGDAGVTDVEAEGAYGIVRGYLGANGDTARAELQPLLLAHGVDASEQAGQLVFASRDAEVALNLTSDQVVARNEGGDIERGRSAEVEEAGFVRIGFVEADGSFETAWEEASQPDRDANGVTVNELPLAMTRPEGRLVAERWLAEAAVARERISFTLPPSATGVQPGTVLRVDGGQPYRVDRVDMAEDLRIEAVRVDAEAYKLARIEETAPSVPVFVPPLPVSAVFLDLPLIEGDEIPHAPHIASFARPWPGNVAVYRQATDGGFDLNTEVTEAAVIGVTETELVAAPCGVLDRGPALQVRLNGGSLDGTDLNGLLNGANRIAIGSGSFGDWEILQFAEAELIADNTYLLRTRLRGLFGTDGVMPDVWPVGSRVVLLSPALKQIALPPSLRSIAQTYRIGAASRALDDASITEQTLAFSGVGLKPYAPCHVSVKRSGSGDEISWIRRSRLARDAWGVADVPVGEEQEAYQLQIRVGGQIVRTETVSSPLWAYSNGQRVTDGADVGYEVEIAQLSAEYGPGASAFLTVGAA